VNTMRHVPESIDHLVPLVDTDWMAWRSALLRTTGFPVDGLGRLCARDAAQAADACLAGSVSGAQYGQVFAAAQARTSGEVRAIAAEPLFREAITWQNPSVLTALDGLRKTDPGRPANRRQRQRERVIARYWQRYCAKTETIGFFGPVCWVTIDPAEPAVLACPGPDLLRTRRVYLEYWALARYAEQLASQLEVRRWLPPVLQPHLTMHGDEILVPAKPPMTLTRAEVAVLARLDGTRPALDIARETAADPLSGLRKAEDVYLLLDQLVSRRVIRWNFHMPVTRNCEQLLREGIAAIGETQLRSQAAAGLERLSRARDQVAAAAGDADSLSRAIGQLEDEFVAVTGTSPTRKPGQMYAARRIYWEEATRDLAVTFGQPVLDVIARPLAVLAQAARWLSAALAEEYLLALRGLYAELAEELGSAQVPLGHLWFLSQGLFYGSAGRPAELVMAEFGRRWAELFDLDPGRLRSHRIQASGTALMAAAARIFPAADPGWPDARLHSPDLQIGAESTDAIRRGDFTVVLGEFHAAWATNACAGAVSGHPDPAALAAALTADLGPGRIHPLLPSDWPRNTPRLAFALGDDHDVILGILPAPGADRARLLPISAVTVCDDGLELIASAADGRRWPLTAVFARPLSEVAVEAFKLADAGPHGPRITIDRMVIARETWRTTVRECGLAAAGKGADAFLAARRWRQELGLPEQVFIKIGTEVKPFFVDFTGPLYVDSLLHMLRAAQSEGGDQIQVCVTEMLPTPDQAWLPDARGRRYISELRLHIRDPAG
jgi:hypothetical protein